MTSTTRCNLKRIKNVQSNCTRTQVGAEAGHEVGGGDEIDGGGERLERELEAASDLLFADLADGADLFERSRHALLPAGDVQTGGRFGIVRAALQVFAVVHLLEQIVRPVGDRFRQVNAVRHRADFLERRNQRPVGAAHRATVLILGSWKWEERKQMPLKTFS